MDFYGTIGPACGQLETLQRMVEAGMTGIRMNLSHGPLTAHADWLAMIGSCSSTCRVRSCASARWQSLSLWLRAVLYALAQTAFPARQLWCRPLPPDSSFYWTTGSFWCR